jgi:hypothetical protein
MISTQSLSDVVVKPFDLSSVYGERFTLGVDLGQARDHTALALVRRLKNPGGDPSFQIFALRQLPLGMSYPEQVKHVMGVLARPNLLGKTELVIDYTGLGRPVFDLFVNSGASPIGINITAGENITNKGPIWHVDKANLVSRVVTLMQDNRCHVHQNVQAARSLIDELESFQAEYSETGRISYNARSGKHDDLILAIAIALFRAEGNHSFNNWMTFMQRQGQPDGMIPGPKLQPQIVKLKRPDHNTAATLYTFTGKSINVPLDGIIEVCGEDAPSLIQNGWTHVEAAAA